MSSGTSHRFVQARTLVVSLAFAFALGEGAEGQSIEVFPEDGDQSLLIRELTPEGVIYADLGEWPYERVRIDETGIHPLPDRPDLDLLDWDPEREFPVFSNALQTFFFFENPPAAPGRGGPFSVRISDDGRVATGITSILAGEPPAPASRAFISKDGVAELLDTLNRDSSEGLGISGDDGRRRRGEPGTPPPGGGPRRKGSRAGAHKGLHTHVRRSCLTEYGAQPGALARLLATVTGNPGQAG